MKRIIQQSRLWLAPAVLAGAALLACNDDGTAQAQNIPAEPEIDAPASPETSRPEARASCDDLLSGSRHVPRC
jgi:hypothetical protein